MIRSINFHKILHIINRKLPIQCNKDFITLFDGHNDSCPFVIFICCYWKPCLTNVQQLLEFSLTLTLLFIEKALFEISSFIYFTLNKTQIFTLADVCRVQFSSLSLVLSSLSNISIEQNMNFCALSQFKLHLCWMNDNNQEIIM